MESPLAKGSHRLWLEGLESALERGIGRAELAATLAFVAGARVDLHEAELHGARRRALLLLAATGDPQRELDPEGRAVTALAAELEGARRREQLEAGLRALRSEARGLELVEAALAALVSDSERAWRLFALALLAEELGDD